MMRLISIIFQLPLQRRDIAGFRASIARAAGYEQDLLHNHREDGSVQYRYPMVQYRSEQGKAALIGINEGRDAIFEWYQKAGDQLLWNKQFHMVRVENLNVQEYEIQYHAQPQRYKLTQWLALNDKNYQNWQSMAGLKDRSAELERVLAAHILTFCRAVNWRLPERLVVCITDIHSIERTRFLGINLMGFDLSFQSNLVLPEGIGLGKGVSHGFGVCRSEIQSNT